MEEWLTVEDKSLFLAACFEEWGKGKSVVSHSLRLTVGLTIGTHKGDFNGQCTSGTPHTGRSFVN